MPNRIPTIEQLLTLLAETPQRLAAMTAGLQPAQLRTGPGEGEWSANEVLAHLRSCADRLGQQHRDPARRGQADNPGRQPQDLDQEDELP